MSTRAIHLELPLTGKAVRELRCGQQVLLSGRLCTARDAAHKYLVSPAAALPPGLSLSGGCLYHCGPVVIPAADGAVWHVTAAGPTTSAREEPYEAEVIRRYGIRAIIGKGGMGAATLDACHQYGCVYLSAVGGAAQLLANAVQEVVKVHFLEQFGSPEAMWELEVADFPAIVTMDSHRGNLHAHIRNDSRLRLHSLFTAAEP